MSGTIPGSSNPMNFVFPDATPGAYPSSSTTSDSQMNNYSNAAKKLQINNPFIFGNADQVNANNVVQTLTAAQSNKGNTPYTLPPNQVGLPPPDTHGGPESSDRNGKYFQERFSINLREQIKVKYPDLKESEVEERMVIFNQRIASNQVDAITDKIDLEILKTAMVTATEETQLFVNLNQATEFFSNAEKNLISFQKAITNTQKNLPANDRSQIALNDLIAIVSAALRELKLVLADMQRQEANISVKAGSSKTAMIDLRMNELNASVEEYKKQVAIQREQAETSQKTKDITFAATMVVGAAMVVMGGVTNPALSISAVLMMSYAAADYKLNLTTQVVQGASKIMIDLFPDEKTREIMKIVLVAVAVVALVWTISATGTAGAGAAVNTLNMQAVKEVGIQVAKQMIIQFSMMAIMASNVIPELFVKILIEMNIVKKDDEFAQEIIKMVVSALMMLAIIAGLSKSAGGAQASQSGVKDAAAQSAGIGTRIANSAKDFAKGLKSLIPSRMSNSQEVGNYIRNVFQTASLTFQIYSGYRMGMLGLDLADLFKQTGQTEKAIQVINLLIKQLDKLMILLNEDREKTMEFLKSVGSAYDQFITATAEKSSKLAQFQV